MSDSRRHLLYAVGQGSLAVSHTSGGNSTIECIESCIGFCNAGDCLAYPPPASSPHNGPGNATTPVNNRDRLLPTLIIIAICFVVVSFLIVMSIYTYIRFHRRGRRNQTQAPDAADIAVSVADDLLPGGEIEHHIWYIRTQGLDEITIASIAAWIYKAGDGVVDCRDCSVCLGELHDGELVRLLPKCNHAFHLPCIDRWLRSHVNCPLCRAPIISHPPGTPPAPPPPLVSATDSPETETHTSDSIESLTQLNNNNDEVELRIGIHPTEDLSSQQVSPDFVPIRRSISMDSISMDVLNREEMGKENILQEEEEVPSSPNREKLGQPLKGCSRMERSLSSRSLRWVFSRKSSLPL